MARTELPLANPPLHEAAGTPEFREALHRAVTGELRFDRLSRALYSTDASVYQIVPLGVVIPRTEEDVAATRRICEQFRVPITARGGGTSQ